MLALTIQCKTIKETELKYIANNGIEIETEKYLITDTTLTPKELKIVLTLFKNGFHLHSNAPKSVNGWGSVPDPQIEMETSAFGACQSDTLG